MNKTVIKRIIHANICIINFVLPHNTQNYFLPNKEIERI